MKLNTVVKVFFWCSFAVFLSASVPHVSYYFRAFAPREDDAWQWAQSYVIAVAIDLAVFLLSLVVLRIKNGWLALIVWGCVFALAGFSWFINWQYALQFASPTMLSRSQSIRIPYLGSIGSLNPIIASMFQVLAIVYTWIADKIAEPETEPVNLSMEQQVHVVPFGTLDGTSELQKQPTTDPLLSIDEPRLDAQLNHVETGNEPLGPELEPEDEHLNQNIKPAEPETEPVNLSMEQQVHSLLHNDQELKLTTIMEAVGCSKGSASRYRNSFLQERNSYAR